MIAGVLHHLGVAMGPCEAPDAANPLGYFEDIRFKGLHRAWSRRYETDPTRKQLKLPPWDPPLNATDLARYARLIQTCEQQPYWGVKDPELCYYAGHFARLRQHPVRVIAVTRNPDAAAASLSARRRWLSPIHCAAVIEEYTRRQTRTLDELASHGIPPALTVDYDETLADPAGMVQRIAEYINLPVTAASASFITPELRNHGQTKPADTLRNDQGVTTLTM